MVVGLIDANRNLTQERQDGRKFDRPPPTSQRAVLSSGPAHSGYLSGIRHFSAEVEGHR